MISQIQYGFRAGRSMMGAVNEVLSNMKTVQSGIRFSTQLVLLATLDINSLLWVDILDALRTKSTIPG